jgi:hypothetical protein
MAIQGDGQRRKAEMTAFHCGGDGAGVDDVIAEIGPALMPETTISGRGRIRALTPR